MNKQLIMILESVKLTFSNKKYFVLFSLAFVVMFSLYFLVPVFAIAGNDIAFQASVFTLMDYFVMIVMASLVALLISLQVKSFHIKKSLAAVSGGAVSGYSGFLAGIFGTASCASCISSVIGFLGTGATFALIKYQGLITLVAALIVVVSIYFTSRGMNRRCGVKK